MCFFQQPQQQTMQQVAAVPSVNSEDAKRRRQQQTVLNERQRGRAASVLTSPLGDPSFGQSVNRTVLVGV